MAGGAVREDASPGRPGFDAGQLVLAAALSV
jgi:hypothetical protein